MMRVIVIMVVALIVSGCLTEAKENSDAILACENIARSSVTSPAKMTFESRARLVKEADIQEVEEQVNLDFEASQDIWMVLVDATVRDEVFQKRIVCILADDNLELVKVFSE